MLRLDSGPDYQLRWPRELLVAELEAARGLGPGAVELVLAEAFAGDEPADDFRRAGFGDFPDPEVRDAMADLLLPKQDGYVTLLISMADRFADYSAPRPYWFARQDDSASDQPLAGTDNRSGVRGEWAELVTDLLNKGYLDRVAPRACVDEHGDPDASDQVLAREIEQRLPGRGLWPLKPWTWNDETFYSLIEIFHDLVARPRSRDYHDFADCGWHYSHFAYTPGRALYRWKVNQLLRRHHVDLQLADSGEDTGRLVRNVDDARADLVARVMTSIMPNERDPVRHAIALFRSREAGRESKRSACIALARVLEERRSLLKTELLSKDEGALFQIANEFDTRHRKANQRGDYDDAYLDWVFWWYLSTIELTNKLLARTPTPARQRRAVARATAMTRELAPTSDPLTVLDEAAVDEPISDSEADYIQAARSANTLRGYRSDWAEFTRWCADHRHDPLPASAAAVAGYLTYLARLGAKVGTMSRRLSAIKFAHQLRNLGDPTTQARVVAVWEGIRRTHGAPPDQATPLMPPELFDVVDACAVTRIWKNRSRPSEPDLAGIRDRALLLVGFVAALRRGEFAALDVDQISDHPNGKVLALPRSKTNQYGDKPELVVLPRAANPARCPVTALTYWLDVAGIDEGPVLRPVSKGNRPLPRRLTAAAINDLVQRAVDRAEIDPEHKHAYSAHSLRAGFVTYAHLRGASDRAIAHQTRHRSLATVGGYVRIETAWEDNAATQLGL